MKTLAPALVAAFCLLRFAGAADPPSAASSDSAAKKASATKKAPAKKTPAKKVAPRKTPQKKTAQKVTPRQKTPQKIAPQQKTAPKTSTPKKTSARRTPRYKPAPPVDPTDGDNVDGDNLTVRRAAVDALGTMNGAVVAVDPSNGRVLSIVNQKLALKSGFVPCSTIKLVTALAALSDGLIERDTPVSITRFASFNLTTAIAHSNNQFFQRLGVQLGYERVTHYARMLGLGEKAGLDIPGEEPGVWPAAPPTPGGVGMMTAYGENILMTPLELAALLSSIANGGKLYYLQYPNTGEAGRVDPALPEAHPGDSLRRHRGRQSRHARRGRFRHCPPRRLHARRSHPRQDRHLHGFPRSQSHGMVWIFQ